MAKNQNWNYRKMAFLVITAGILIRFGMASFYSVSGDACWQLSVSRFIAENHRIPVYELLGRMEPFWAPPMFHFMAAFFYGIFSSLSPNSGEFGMKMISPLFGSLSLVVSYLIARKLFDEKTAFYSTVFVAFLPMFLDYGIVSYIDSTVTFFITLSIYFALNDRHLLSAVAAGLAAMTKYNGIFIFPLLAYIVYRNTRNKIITLKKLAAMVAILALIGAPWFARNYAEFQNPFWPFFNFMSREKISTDLAAADSLTFTTFNPLNLLSFNSITFTYLAFFGVPEGNYKNLFFFDIPNLSILLVIWLSSTLFFIFPIFKGFKMKDKPTAGILYIWMAMYALVLALYISNVRWNATRFFLPAVPALGMIWGNGMSRIIIKNKKLKIVFLAIFSIIIIGFIFTVAAKILLASSQWNFYKEDFEWVMKNTESSAVIMPGIQCLSYYTHRGTLEGKPENLKKADYLWLNKNFKLESNAIASQELVDAIRKNEYEKAYENKKTGTSIYRIK